MRLSLTVAALLLVASESLRSEPLTLTWDAIFTRAQGDRSAVLSPDGEWVAVTASDADGTRIYLVDTDGGEPEPWVDGASPPWSSDGEPIVYRADGESGETRKLTSGLMAPSTAFWSPKGDRLALLGTAKDEYWNMYRRLEAFFDQRHR